MIGHDSPCQPDCDYKPFLACLSFIQCHDIWQHEPNLEHFSWHLLMSKSTLNKCSHLFRSITIMERVELSIPGHGFMSLYSTHTVHLHQHQPFSRSSFITSLLPTRECSKLQAVMSAAAGRKCWEHDVATSTWTDYFSNGCVGGKYMAHDWHQTWVYYGRGLLG